MNMNATPAPAVTQAEIWNGYSGRAWVEAQAVTDQMFRPLETLLVEAVGAVAAQEVLDVGCGTGSTTLVVARQLWPQGHCTGADVSAPLIAAAQARAKREGVAASFLCADVQTHAFAPASFDMIISRFGVMFFEDPIAAFANLRGAARGDAELRFVAWRSAAENPFMTTAERAAAPLLPNLPARRPGAPGQFAFAERQRIFSILEESGWRGIDIQPIDAECALSEEELFGYFTRLGPVGQAIQQADEAARKQIVEAVRRAFDPYVHGAEVRYTAACWMVSAKAPEASA